MKILSKLMLIVIATTQFQSCAVEESDSVSQNKIYAEYELFYDKNTDKTYASAIFKFSNINGTNLKLSAPSEVRFNNDVIPFDQNFAYYRKEYAGKVAKGTFIFKDKDGLFYTNNAEIANEITNPAVTTINRANGSFTYTFTGTSLQQNELIGLVIGSKTVTTNFQVFLQNAIGATNLVLPLSQLNLLSLGDSYCQLDRQIEVTTGNFTSAGGKVRGKYRAQDTNLTIQ